MEGRRFQDLGRSTDGRRVEHASGSVASDSLYMEQQVLRTAEPQLFGSSSNHTGRMDDCLPEASGNQELLNTTGACSSEGHHHSGADRTSLRHSISGSVLENATHSVFGNTRGSSRSSACKRKSCTSVVAGSLSCGTGSLRTGFRDSNGGRTVGGNGMSRRTIGISGCTSASDVVASTSSSAAASARSSELPIVASGLEETATHRAASLRETLDLMPETHRGSRLGKSVVTSSSAGTSSQRSTRAGGVGVALVEAGTAQHSHTPFAQTMYRSAVPAMQHDHCGSQRTTSSESLVDANEESSSSSLLVPDETPASSSTLCHSGSPSRLTGRSGMPSSPRHRDNGVGLFSLGEQLSHRQGSYSGKVVLWEQILFALECVERDEDLTYEQLLMLEATLLFEGMGLHDHHRELRLDVDNMSYEELLALEDRIGNVSTGLTAEAVADKLKTSYYSSLNMAVARFSQEYDIKCSICQEEYEDGDELGKVDCGHSYHVLCIQQWLVQKNQCPICKAPAFA
ncbi:unnamed protein product [Sphagnum jensenii]